jgi:hypothetical protein
LGFAELVMLQIPPDHLPQNLTYLDLRSAPIQAERLHILPQSLQTLITSAKIGDDSVAYLPRNLTHLDTWNSCITDNGVSFLPRSLRTLKLIPVSNPIGPFGVRNLPKQISTFHHQGCPRPYLHLEYFNSLPRSVTDLHMSEFTLSDKIIESLPPLRSVGYSKLIVYRTTTSEILVEFMKQLTERCRAQLMVDIRQQPCNIAHRTEDG